MKDSTGIPNLSVGFFVKKDHRIIGYKKEIPHSLIALRIFGLGWFMRLYCVTFIKGPEFEEYERNRKEYERNRKLNNE